MAAISETTTRKSSVSPRATAVALALAAVIWLCVLAWRQAGAPVRAHIEAGREFAMQGQARRAEEEWLKAVKLDPKNQIAWEALGELYMSTGNWPGGVRAFRQLATLAPSRKQVHGRLAVCLLRVGDEKGAYEESVKELKTNPNDVAAVTISALLSSNMGDFQKEVAGLRKLLEINPESVTILTLLAENLIFTHKYPEAREIIERILKIDPNHSEAYALRGTGWFNSDTTPEGRKRAEEDFRHSLRLNPLAPFPRLFLGKIYRRMKQPDKAVFQLEEARRLTPGKLDIFFELAAAYEEAGKPDEAADARKRFKELRGQVDRKNGLLKKCAVNPNNFDYNLELGLVALDEGDMRIARAYLSRAQGLRPNDKRPEAALQKMARLTGDAPDPRDALRASAAENPGADGSRPE